MFSVAIFFIILLLLFILSCVVSKVDIISPSVVFSFSFLFQSVWVLLYADKWKLGLHLNTFLIITLGVSWFLIVSYLINALMNKGVRTNRIANRGIGVISINPVMEILFFVFCVVFLLVYLFSIVSAVGGSLSSLESISDSIGEYDRLLKFTSNYDVVQLPFIINQLKVVVVASGYWFMYVILNNWIAEKKIRFIELGILICSILVSVVSGSRTPVFLMIVAGISYGILIIEKQIGKTDVLDIKKAVLLGTIGIIFLGTFLSFGLILGRNISGGTMDYLSIYTGAQVKNLDLFLQNPVRRNDIWGSQTFIPLVQFCGEKIGFAGYSKYNLDLPFRSVDGIGLGNVYTTFYPYIYDFGYLGCFVIVGIMAVISQFTFQKARNSKVIGSPSIATLIYGMIFSCLLLSFFSNKFFEEIITFAMLKYIVIWLFFNFIFTRKMNLFGKTFVY